MATLQEEIGNLFDKTKDVYKVVESKKLGGLGVFSRSHLWFIDLPAPKEWVEGFACSSCLSALTLLLKYMWALKLLVDLNLSQLGSIKLAWELQMQDAFPVLQEETC